MVSNKKIRYLKLNGLSKQEKPTNIYLTFSVADMLVIKFKRRANILININAFISYFLSQSWKLFPSDLSRFLYTEVIWDIY